MVDAEELPCVLGGILVTTMVHQVGNMKDKSVFVANCSDRAIMVCGSFGTGHTCYNCFSVSNLHRTGKSFYGTSSRIVSFETIICC